jgi:hypothetical protein
LSKVHIRIWLLKQLHESTSVSHEMSGHQLRFDFLGRQMPFVQLLVVLADLRDFEAGTRRNSRMRSRISTIDCLAISHAPVVLVRRGFSDFNAISRRATCCRNLHVIGTV